MDQSVPGDCFRIRDINGKGNLVLSNMKAVQNIWKPLPAGCCGPISEPHKKMRIITVEQDHYLLDIFLYDEYFEKLSFLSVGDKISINAPRTLVYSYVPREIADGQSLKIAKQFMPFTIALYPKVSDQCRVSFFIINNIKLISRHLSGLEFI